MNKMLYVKSILDRIIELYYVNLKLILSVTAVLLYLFLAFNSHGFYHPDEHWQILEFANYKLGNNTLVEMPWEYNAKMRSTIQPAMAYLCVKVFDLLSIKSPYVIAFFLRFLSGVFSLTTLYFFIKQTKEVFIGKGYRLFYYSITIFLCFLPYLNIRFSSETWSGLLLVWAVCLLLSNNKSGFYYYLLGVLLGLSFLFRFQIAFAVFGVFGWLFYVDKAEFVSFLKVGGAFLLVLAIGVCIDSWFYQEFTFTPYNYFYQNIVEGKAAGFGTSPWYFYMVHILLNPVIFIGGTIGLSLLIFVVIKPKHIITWVLVPFILFHSFVGHKELRFLFPLVNFLPFVITMVLYEFRYYFVANRLIRSFAVFVVLVNLIVLTFVVLKPLGADRQVLTKYVYNRFNNENVKLVYVGYAYPFVPLDVEDVPMNFYKQKNLFIQQLPSLDNFNDIIPNTNGPTLIMLQRKFVQGELKLGTSNKWLPLAESDPLSLKCVDFFNEHILNVLESGNYFVLYKYNNEFNSELK